MEKRPNFLRRPRSAELSTESKQEDKNPEKDGSFRISPPDLENISWKTTFPLHLALFPIAIPGHSQQRMHIRSLKVPSASSISFPERSVRYICGSASRFGYVRRVSDIFFPLRGSYPTHQPVFEDVWAGEADWLAAECMKAS